MDELIRTNEDSALTQPRRKPLSIGKMVQAVNTINEYVKSCKIQPSTEEDGTFAITLDANRTQGLILHALEASKVRGYSQGFGMSLDGALGAPAVAHLSLSVKVDHNVQTLTEYLVLYEGDDPVRLFLQTLKRLIPQKALNSSGVDRLLLT